MTTCVSKLKKKKKHVETTEFIITKIQIKDTLRQTVTQNNNFCSLLRFKFYLFRPPWEFCCLPKTFLPRNVIRVFPARSMKPRLNFTFSSRVIFSLVPQTWHLGMISRRNKPPKENRGDRCTNGISISSREKYSQVGLRNSNFFSFKYQNFLTSLMKI